jgi:heme/copper-type cytochrome/quinol oxidase subunit 4
MNMEEDTKLQQLGENLRFYGDMRFKQLTLLIALLSLIGAGVSQFGDKTLIDSIKTKEVLAIAGMLFTGVLWIMEVRSSIYWAAHREHARDLWPSPNNVRLSWLNASNSVLVLYLSIFAFWSVCAHFWISNILITVASAFAGFILLLFSILNYIYLWHHKDERKG